MKQNNKNNLREDLNVLFYDIETAPVKAYLWNRFTTVMGQDLHPEDQQSILTIAYKFNGEKEATVLKIDINNVRDDSGILTEFAKILEKADYAVGHYSTGFDWPKLMWRYAFHRLPCPNKPVQIDTYRQMKGKFLNDWSNKLDHIGQMLGLGGKSKVGWEVWCNIMEGKTLKIKKEALHTLAEYNKRDVILLEDIFNALLPYYGTVFHYKNTEEKCPHCGSTHVKNNGFRLTQQVRYQRKQCNSCGHWFRGAPVKLEDEVKTKEKLTLKVKEVKPKTNKKPDIINLEVLTLEELRSIARGKVKNYKDYKKYALIKELGKHAVSNK